MYSSYYLQAFPCERCARKSLQCLINTREKGACEGCVKSKEKCSITPRWKNGTVASTPRDIRYVIQWHLDQMQAKREGRKPPSTGPIVPLWNKVTAPPPEPVESTSIRSGRSEPTSTTPVDTGPSAYPARDAFAMVPKATSSKKGKERAVEVIDVNDESTSVVPPKPAPKKLHHSKSIAAATSQDPPSLPSLTTGTHFPHFLSFFC